MVSDADKREIRRVAELRRACEGSGVTLVEFQLTKIAEELERLRMMQGKNNK